MEVIRKRIVFYGWVQGVGFRYRAYYAANDAGATGWVKNNYDNTVTMEIQGTESQIDSVIMAISRGTFIKIDNMDCKTIETISDERDFRIR